MNCPNCGTNDPPPVSTDNGTTTCPRCGHRFPIDDLPDAFGARGVGVALARGAAAGKPFSPMRRGS